MQSGPCNRPRAKNQTGGDFVAADWENAHNVCNGSSLAHDVGSDPVRTDVGKHPELIWLSNMRGGKQCKTVEEKL